MKSKMSKITSLLAGTLSSLSSAQQDETPSQSQLVVDEFDDVQVGGLNLNLPNWIAAHRSHASHSSHGSHRSSSGGASPRPAPVPIYRESVPLVEPARPRQSIPTNDSVDKSANLQSSLKDPSKLKNIVMRIQLTLQISGYYDGNIDGVMDDETRDALNKYRDSQGISRSQTLDVKTLDSLGIIVY